MPYPVHVPVDRPYPVKVLVPEPYPVEKPVAVPVKVPVSLCTLLLIFTSVISCTFFRVTAYEEQNVH